MASKNLKVLSGSFPPCCSPASRQLPRFILQPSGCNHSHHRMLMEFTLRVHQLRLAPLDPHPLVHLPLQTRLEGSNHLHGKFHLFTLVRNKAMLPKCIFLLFLLQSTLMFFPTAVAITPSLSLVSDHLKAPFTGNPVACSVFSIAKRCS